MWERLFNIFESKKEKHPKFIIKGVPYFSQWESPNLVHQIIKGEISAKDDSFWKNSGATNEDEYERWARNMCGMACLKMILSHKFNKNFPIIELGKKCANYGGYVERESAIDGLYYKPFVKFIKDEFGLEGKVIAPLDQDGIRKELDYGNYVIASVSHEIRNPESKPIKKGGHLVLVLGFDMEKKIFLIHNPSGDTDGNQKYSEISFSDFSKFFAGRGITING